MNFYSRTIKTDSAARYSDELVIECRRYKKAGKRWSISLIDGFRGQEYFSQSMLDLDDVRKEISMMVIK